MFEGKKHFAGPNVELEKGLYSEFDKHDILSRCSDLFARGYLVNDRGLITASARSLATNTPWIHVQPAPGKKCNLDSHVIFEHWGFVPSRCQECWKVVVAPRSLKELFGLLELEKQLGLPSKCGIEVREYTPRMYGGYFYSNSLEQGRERYRIVREAVSQFLSPDITVILKRGCTEMEMSCGPSPMWKVTQENLELEAFIEQSFEAFERKGAFQPDYILANIKNRWIRWAFAHGDTTYLEYTDGVPLYPDTVKYNEGDLDEIKRDLRRQRTVLSGVPKETAGRLMKDIPEILSVLKISEKQLAEGLGFQDLSPLAIGGHDETTG